MRLIKLTSNQHQFKSISFNPNGITIIKASRLNKDKNIDDKKKTINGVGKSLIVHIIDFCLASDPIKQFQEKLVDWSFILYFSINNKEYKIERYCSNQAIIFLDDKEYNYKYIRDFLFDKVFDGIDIQQSISFRSVINRFLRSPSKGYFYLQKPNTTRESDYHSLLYTSWFLGLDTNLIETKYRLVKEKKLDIQKAKSLKEHQLESNSFKKKYNKSKLRTEILDLKDNILRKDKLLSEYKIAENYKDILEKADKLTSDLRKIDDDITSNNIIINQIQNSLKIKYEFSKKDLENLFEETKLIFTDQIKKTIEEVEYFHSQLLIERKRRLKQEEVQYKLRIENLEKQRAIKSKERDEFLVYLDKHKALDEYNAVQQEIFSLKKEKDKLENYLLIITKEEDIKETFKYNLDETNIKTKEYLEDNKEILDKLLYNFRKLSSGFYKDKAGGIIIENNVNENQIRFDIKIIIDDDASSGISEVKMFCFDILILILKQNHHVNFVFHDSSLFSNMDPRQRLQVFKTMQYITKEHNVQYICTVNEDQLDFDGDIPNEEYEELINNNIVLELTDKDDSSRLLGRKIHLEL